MCASAHLQSCEGTCATEESQRPVTEDGSKRTRNLGFADEPGRLRPLGTAQSTMSVGGRNVHREEVDSVLADKLDVPAVAAVRRNDDTMGKAVVAVVAPPRSPGLSTLPTLGAAA